MKIGIDARMLGTGFGLARYIQQLVLHLEDIDHVNEYVLFLRKENWDEAMITHDNFKKVLADIPWYSLAEQCTFKKIIQKEKLDLMHFPHFNVPLLYHDPFVVTIHDLTMYHFPRPEATTRSKIIFWIKDKAHRLVIRHAVRRARQIITTSQFTAQDIHHTLGVPLDKMKVIYQAPFVETDIRFKTKDLRLSLPTYGITKPYILYVGAAYPHKNLERLLQAWKLFEERYGEDYQLVLVGKEDYFYKRLLKDYKIIRLKDYRVDNVAMYQCNNVVYTGFVPDNELVELYESAHLYVFPSLYEGFGLPPLEAMNHGTPVISSSASCMPEILGESVMYFDPQNVEQMAEVMHKVLSNKDIQMELNQNTREHLKLFSWERLAKQTLEIYNRY